MTKKEAVQNLKESWRRRHWKNATFENVNLMFTLKIDLQTIGKRA